MNSFQFIHFDESRLFLCYILSDSKTLKSFENLSSSWKRSLRFIQFVHSTIMKLFIVLVLVTNVLDCTAYTRKPPPSLELPRYLEEIIINGRNKNEFAEADFSDFQGEGINDLM